jgi:hypothetical protein
MVEIDYSGEMSFASPVDGLNGGMPRPLRPLCPFRPFRPNRIWTFLLLAVMAAAQNPHPQTTGDVIGPLSHIEAPPAGHGFPEGVTYVYGGEWRIWTAGTATLRLEKDGDKQRVLAAADSSGVAALLYPLHDRFQAVFDPRSFCSQSIVKHSEEGAHKRDTSIHFNYALRKSLLDETNLKDNSRKHEEQDIPTCVTDVVSGIYYLAALPLRLGSTYVFPLNDGGKTVDVRATVEAREQVKTDAGTFSTLRVHTEASSGVLKDRGKVWFWYTDDAQRIPVQMRARVFYGTLTLKLERVEK